MEVSMYETLANSPFFNGLTAKEIQAILQTVNYKKYTHLQECHASMPILFLRAS